MQNYDTAPARIGKTAPGKKRAPKGGKKGMKRPPPKMGIVEKAMRAK